MKHEGYLDGRPLQISNSGAEPKNSSLPITTVGVVAGMFSDAELVATIKGRQIPIFFEHDLARLVEFLKSGFYYGVPWNPGALFTEVPTRELAEALENIQTTPVEGEANVEQQAEERDRGGT